MRYFLLICLVLGTFAMGVALAQDAAEPETNTDAATTEATADTTQTTPATERREKSVIRLDEGEVEGQLSRPQVVFLLQHNEHAYRTFNIRKDMSKQLHDYTPRHEMQTRYRIFYVEHLKERMW